jgi:VIT1/CCC1 family predicted Fe2+/Mn2+ transporter
MNIGGFGQPVTVVDEFKLTVTGAAFIATAVLPCAPLFIRTPVWLAFMTTPCRDLQPS